MAQSLSSLFIALPVLLSVKLFEQSDMTSIVFFSFATNLVVGFTKNVLVTERSTKAIIESKSKKIIIQYHEILLLFTTSLLPLAISSIFLSKYLLAFLAATVGIISMSITEFILQLSLVSSKSNLILLSYVRLLALFATSLTISSHFLQLTPFIVISNWSLASFISTVIVARNVEFMKQRNGTNRINLKSLTIDFFSNYGCMQILYSLGPILTDDSELIQFRLLMLLAIPTNLVIGNLSTSGLPIFFEDVSQRVKRIKQFVFFVLAVIPVSVLVAALNLIGANKLQKYFGAPWINMPSKFPLFLVMIFTSVLLAFSTMNIRWRRLVQQLLISRVIVAAVQLPVTIYLIHSFGCVGILSGLIFFNLIFGGINYLFLSRIRNEHS
jgi:hypothetical protein